MASRSMTRFRTLFQERKPSKWTYIKIYLILTMPMLSFAIPNLVSIPIVILIVSCSISYIACIMVLPKLTFVLFCAPFLSPLSCSWSFVVVHYDLSVSETWVCAELDSYGLDCYSKGSKSIQHCWKWSVVIQQCNQATHLLLNW